MGHCSVEGEDHILFDMAKEASDRPVIGVVGGIGPAAGVDCVRRILTETAAQADEEHVPVALLSFPDRIEDRTAFLEGKVDRNPGVALADVGLALEKVGATVAGLVCNTAHAAPIFDAMQARLEEAGSKLKVLHLIEETVRFIQESYPDARRIGVLSTRGTRKQGIYTDALERAGLEALYPDDEAAEEVHELIYDRYWGLKARNDPPDERAVVALHEAIEALAARDADVIIMGCTELILGVPDPEVLPVPLVDPVTALARALLRETYPERLRPLAEAPMHLPPEEGSKG